MKARIAGKNGEKLVDLNRRAAIRERCLDCVAWFPGEVTNCRIDSCPLHPFRTGRGHQDAKTRSRAIRQYCFECGGGQRGEIAKCLSPSCALYIFRQGSPST